MCTGTIGVVLKPLLGVLDSTTHMTENLRTMAKSVANVSHLGCVRRLRDPHVFGEDGRLLRYQRANAESTMFLCLQREHEQHGSLTRHVTRALMFEGAGSGTEQRDLVVHTEFVDSRLKGTSLT